MLELLKMCLKNHNLSQKKYSIETPKYLVKKNYEKFMLYTKTSNLFAIFKN